MRDFVEQLKARLTPSHIIGEYIKLTRKGKDFWGLCPFHKERSSSFVVHDDTGRFHCFGCGEGGDVISFLEKHRHLSFREALEELAPKAGLVLPQNDMMGVQGAKMAQERAAKKEIALGIYEALSQATAWFHSHLWDKEGERARAYLHRRGLSRQAVQTFQLGWAEGNETSGILDGLVNAQKLTRKFVEQAGLVFEERDGKKGRDRFRQRLMFPIHDERGRVIGFGGRTLGSDEPKYLNSPETLVFEKNQHLYGLWQSLQQKTLKEKPVVVVEGYLDVIALHIAGLARAVAPLGTAMGEAQLLKAWRLSPEPIVCFDGDSAGRTAALRTAIKALPLLKPGFSLCFCQLPEKEDPQSLLAKKEETFLASLFSQPLPLVDYLWHALSQSNSLQTPETQAASRQKYKEWCALIQHMEIRKLYERYFDEKFYELTRDLKTRQRKTQKGNSVSFSGVTLVPSVALRSKRRQELRLHILIVTLIHHPRLLKEYISDVSGFVFPQDAPQGLYEALVEWGNGGDTTLDLSEEKDKVKDYLNQKGLMCAVVDWLDFSQVLQHAAFARPEKELEVARSGFQDVLEHYQREAALKQELEEAHTTFARHMHEKSWRRFQKLKELYVQLK